MSSVAPWLEPLNAAQRRAVTLGEVLPERKGFTSGPLLIIAGAGTGKTSTLAHRVAYLVLNGVDPARILLLTFTRRAALEMRRRATEIVRKALDDTLGGKAQVVAQRLSWAGTFHSIGNRLLRHYAPQLGLNPAFTVVDRSDSSDLMDTLRTELGLAAKEQRFPRKDTCLAIYSYRVNTEKTLKESLEQQFPWCVAWEEDLTKLYRSYVERKQKYGLLDYDDLLLYWHILMSEPRLAQHVGAHFDHVLVDEYQDTNRLQAQILEGMKPTGTGLTVVGDDAQAIYSFRAAAVENILGFPQRYTPPAEVVPLAQNYRSTQEVLDASNALMAEAPRQHRKHLLAVRGAGAIPRYITVDDLNSQAEYVSNQVLQRREAGTTLRRQAVLFRSASHSDLLEVELARRKIPFVKYGGLKFLEASHVKDLIAVLRWADNPRNTLAAFRTLQLLPGMGPVNARHCVEMLETGGGLLAALREFKPPEAARLDMPRLLNLLGTLASRSRLGGTDAPRARVVPAAPGTHLRTLPHAHWRPGSARAARGHLPLARTFHYGADARPAAGHERPGGLATARRRLPHPLDGPLGQGHGVGHGVPAERRRWQFPVGVRDRQTGNHRRGAPAALRRDDPRAQRTAAHQPAEIPPDPAVAARRRARLRRPQPLHQREGTEVLRADQLQRLTRQRRRVVQRTAARQH